eukprot:7386314-Prymnesium_polylepis.2
MHSSSNTEPWERRRVRQPPQPATRRTERKGAAEMTLNTECVKQFAAKPRASVRSRATRSRRHKD